MRNYGEMIHEIDVLMNSKEVLDIYKEQCELDILNSYIENQLYLREYNESSDISSFKIDMYIEAAMTKQAKWYQKVIKYTQIILAKVWKLISNIFKWVGNAIKQLLKFIAQQKEEDILSKAKSQLNGTAYNGESSNNLYNEDAQQALDYFKKKFIESHDKYKKIYSDFSTKVDSKLDMSKLIIKINGENFTNLFSENNPNGDSIKKICENNNLKFSYNWQDSQNKAHKNEFTMTSIETFDNVTDEIFKYINTQYNDLMKAYQTANNVSATVSNSIVNSMGGSTPGISSNAAKIISPNTDIDTKQNAVFNLLGQLGTAGILAVGAYCNMNIMGFLPQIPFVQKTAIAISTWLIATIGKGLLKNQLFKFQFTNNLEFTISKSIDSLQNDITKINSVLFTDIDKKEQLIEKFFKDNKELLEKEIQHSLVNVGKTAAAGVTHVAAGFTQQNSKFNPKILQNINDSTYIAEAYKFFKNYTDLNINMITIITFSANIREIILNALSLNS